MIIMKGSGGRLALALAIPLLVAPLAGLTWLAARSVDQQESGMRERLRESLLLEVAQTNARIGAWFTDLPEGLRASAPRGASSGRPTERELAAWKKQNPLVGTPFLLNASGAIVYPTPNEDSRLFYWRYLNVFSNAERIPVYRNIASEYEASIVGPEATTRAVAKDSRKSTASDDSAIAAAQPEVQPEVQASKSEEAQGEALEAAKADATADAKAEAPRSVISSVDMLIEEEPNAAFSDVPADAPSAAFSAESEQAKPAKRSLLGFSAKMKEAASEARAPEKTDVPSPAPSADASAVRSNIAQSIFKTDSTVQADSGLVPRIFDNSFVLLYWEKRGDWIVGCELDMDAVREAIAARSGTPADGLRYLAVLDQSGVPLVPVAGMEAAAWRTPLVSGEISEFLPYWETAVILSDPSAFESRVRASRYALSTLVLALFLSVAGGAVFLWRYSAARLLEAKRRTGFVTTVSHELKTPLTSIRMYSEMLAGGADLDRKKRDRYLAQIVGESERLTHLINDVLDVAKLERGKRRLVRVPVDIALVAKETALGIADRLKAAGFSVTFTAEESPALAMADKDAVVRILLNLLSNAEKYSGDGREIEVTVGFDEKRARCFASVADRGIGVPCAHRKRIFREFHRVDATLTSEQGGTGLGLSIARALARSLGGDVRYAPRDRSGREKGSVFTLSLPAAGQKDGNQ